MRARHRRPVMYFAGLDAHLRYVSVAVLDRSGELALETTVSTREPEQLLAALAPYRPLEVVVETCPFWPWLYDLLVPAGIGFHLAQDRKSTRLNSSHLVISYAVFCLKKKKKK